MDSALSANKGAFAAKFMKNQEPATRASTAAGQVAAAARSLPAHRSFGSFANMLKALAISMTAVAATAAAAQGASTAVAKGASLGPDGYATILDAPPPPFTPIPPVPPKPLSPEQLAGHEQFRRAAEFQNRVRNEVTALAERLRVAEKGNFVDLYFDNEGEPSAVFQFLRDGPATLRKYTSNPRFRAETVRFSREELIAAMDFMLENFRDDRVIESGGVGADDSVTIRISITEEEFRALVARKGMKIPEAVKLEFPVQRPASEVNAPLPPHIASLVRIFPRDNQEPGPVPDINSTVKVVLQDGCFRLADKGNALALFPLGAQLIIDRQGYLAFAPETSGYARVGEEVEFHGIASEVTAPELVGPIHAACGTGKVLKINGMRSAAAGRAQSTVDQNARAFRDLREMYGLPEPLAVALLERCKAHVGGSVCLLSPPPPVRRQEDCPEPTKLSGGLCRTPEGYIRPIPKWLQDLLPAD